jgi:hypothetical protein
VFRNPLPDRPWNRPIDSHVEDAASAAGRAQAQQFGKAGGKGEEGQRRCTMVSMRRKFEKPQKGNQYQLSVDQHVLSLASIARFANADGKVCLFDKIRRKARAAKPDDKIFCVKRVWDQRAESVYMRSIESAFQEFASQVVAGGVTTIDPAQKGKVDAFFALWKLRADYKASPDGEIAFKGVTGEEWTKDQEERVEKAGVSFLRPGGKMPLRMLYGLQIQFRIDAYLRDLSSVQWGIVNSLEGHFLVPDYPAYTFIPLTPTLCLCSGGQTGSITKENLAEINRSLRLASREYFFAQNLAHCP